MEHNHYLQDLIQQEERFSDGQIDDGRAVGQDAVDGVWNVFLYHNQAIPFLLDGVHRDNTWSTTLPQKKSGHIQVLHTFLELCQILESLNLGNEKLK